MTKKRKSARNARNGSLRICSRLGEESEACLRRRYGDEKFEFLRDDALILDFFLGQSLADDNSVVGVQFLESGSAKEREAMAAVARVLTSVREFIESENPAEPRLRLAPFVLDGLAKMLDLRLGKMKRKLAVSGGGEDSRRGIIIAAAVAREVRAGTKTTAAWKLVGEGIGYSAKTVQRSWEKYKHMIVSEPG